MHAVADVHPFAAAVGHWIGVIGIAIEIFGVMVIVSGLAWSTWLFARERMAERHFDAYKIRIGRSLLLGLEVVVAADIVRTIALELTLKSLALLAGLVLIRTFLSWTLVLEIEGRWPWQREAMVSDSLVTREVSGECNAANASRR